MNAPPNGAPALLRPEWPAPAGVRAAFTLRTGGVSAAPFGSLNLGAHVGDDVQAVAENRRRVAAALSLPNQPLWLAQQHGVTVVKPDEQPASWRAAPAGNVPAGDVPVGGAQGGDARAGDGLAGSPPVGDAAVTRCAGRVLAVLVADCLPVLLARRDGTAVAVAHAGWRGLAAGVIEATIDALRVSGEQLLAWLGPAIGAAHFEVGEEVRVEFCRHDPRAAAAFERNARGRWQCDLARLARQRLAARGVHAVHGDAPCTYADAAAFYSYRRDGATGRMAALIWLEA